MSADPFDPGRVLETIFTRALEKTDPAERAAFLDGACGADALLRQRVERLLRAHGQAGASPEALSTDLGDTGDVWAPPDPGPAGHVVAAPRPIDEERGTRIGPFKLQQSSSVPHRQVRPGGGTLARMPGDQREESL
jgi:hypothetical protein